MNRCTASLVSLLLAFTFGVAAATLRPGRGGAPADAHAPREQAEAPREFGLVIPQSVWEPIFFRHIDERAGTAGLPTLRAPLPEGDLELRVWGGFGLSALEGFRLRRAGARWSAEYFGADFRDKRWVEYGKSLPPPKSGWEGAWNRLAGLGLMELPDAESAGCSTRVADGYSYVVETNVNRVYRTYMYDNPTFSECAEAGRMLGIAAALAEEFRLGRPSPAEKYRPAPRGGRHGRE